jgi:hypothetical protein
MGMAGLLRLGGQATRGMAGLLGLGGQATRGIAELLRLRGQEPRNRNFLRKQRSALLAASACQGSFLIPSSNVRALRS